jgi:hypothetical protein
MFHAPWSSYNSNEAHQGEVDDMAEAMEPLLYQAQVDAVFSGHVHAYERSARVYRGRVGRGRGPGRGPARRAAHACTPRPPGARLPAPRAPQA